MGKIVKNVFSILLILAMAALAVCSLILSGLFSCRYPKPGMWQMMILFMFMYVIIPLSIAALTLVGLIRKYSVTFIVSMWILALVMIVVLRFAFVITISGSFVSYTEIPENFGKWDKTVEEALRADELEDVLLQCSADAEIREYRYSGDWGVPSRQAYYSIYSCFAYKDINAFQRAAALLKQETTGYDGSVNYSIEDGRRTQMVYLENPSENTIAVAVYGGYQYELPEMAEKLTQMIDAAAS